MFLCSHGRKLIFLEFFGFGMQIECGQNTVSTIGFRRCVYDMCQYVHTKAGHGLLKYQNIDVCHIHRETNVTS